MFCIFGILVDSESGELGEGLATYIANREKNSGDIHAGNRKLGRLLRKSGFSLEKMSASYDVITETLLKIGPSLADQFAKPSHCGLENKADASLFVALACCEAIGRRTTDSGSA